MVVAQLENALPSKLHSKPATGFVAGVAEIWNVMDVETIEPSLSTGFPLPLVAEVIIVFGGAGGVVQ